MFKVPSVLSGLTLFGLSQVAFATPGHDHSHIMSHSIHLITFTAVVSVVVASIALFKRRVARAKAITISTKPEV